jgi:hypothetical protein
MLNVFALLELMRPNNSMTNTVITAGRSLLLRTYQLGYFLQVHATLNSVDGEKHFPAKWAFFVSQKPLFDAGVMD